jgi:hypothetical protein
MGFWLLFALVSSARAHRPALEDQFRNAQQIAPCDSFSHFSPKVVSITDPTYAALSIYGRLEWPNEVDFYTFTPAKNDALPIEALVPVRQFNSDFRPAVIFIGRDIPPAQQSATPAGMPFTVPEGFHARLISPPQGERGVFFERRTLERLYRGNEQVVQVTAGQPYYIALYEPNHFTGSYALDIGSVDNLKGVSKFSLLKTILAIKFEMFGERRIPWMDVLGMFLAATGLTLGAGGVVVLLLSRNSSSLMVNQSDRASRILRLALRYIWAGTLLAIVGGAMMYRRSYLSGVGTFQAMLALAMVFYAVYLSSRRTEAGGGLGVFSAIWASQVFLFAWYLLMLR